MSARGAVVLLYHRVARLGSDPFGIAVNPDRFAEHMRSLSKVGEPRSVDAVVEGLDRGVLPERAICVTFDDGYADNLTAAVPVLRDGGVPATVFVASDGIDAEAFWWDELTARFLGPDALPSRARFRFGRKRIDEVLDGAWDAEAHGGWSARTDPPPTDRHRAFLQVFEALKRLRRAERLDALREIREWSGPGPIARTSDAPLRAESVRELAQAPGITIGAHTVSHPRLSKLGRADRRIEVGEGRRRLEELVGHEVDLFAYPFGDAKRSRGVVSAAGMRAAFTTRPGPVTRDSDRLELPRVYVGDWPAVELERAIERRFDEIG